MGSSQVTQNPPSCQSQWVKCFCHYNCSNLKQFAVNQITQFKLCDSSHFLDTMIEFVVKLNKLSKSIFGVEPNLLSPLELLQEKFFCFRCWCTKKNAHQSHLPLIFRDERVFNKISRVAIRQRNRVILPNKSQFHYSVHCSSLCHTFTHPICK